MKLSELFSKVCKEKSYSEKQDEKMYTAIEDQNKLNKKVNELDTSRTWLDEADELKRINSIDNIRATSGSESYINLPYETTTSTTMPDRPRPWSESWEGWLGSFAKKAGKVLAKIGFIRNNDEDKFGLKISCNIEIDDVDVGLNENTEKVINEYFDRLSIEIKNEITWRKSLAMLLITGEKQKEKDKEDNQ